MINTQDITGLVLAGGRGSRMGGVDKGLQNFRGLPLALHTLMRLQMQTGASMVNANRNLAAYEEIGLPLAAVPHQAQLNRAGFARPGALDP
jgi:molybdopterin-guanine dinucleotide biosynthesis protein A